MDKARCDLTDLIKDQCAHCRNVPDPTPKRRPMATVFPASYSGDCAGCGSSFDEGEQIRSDGEGGWLAECCDGDGA